MTKEEIQNKIDALESNIYLESFKDRGYDTKQVELWQSEIVKLKKLLKE